MQTHHDVSVRVSVDGNAESRLKAIGSAVRHVGAQIVSTGVTAAIRGLGAGISFLANVARAGIQWLVRLGTVAAGLAAAGLLGVAYAMGKLVTASMSLGAGRQAAEASLINIMGNAKAAGAAILELRQIAKAPGINFEQALGGYMQLKSQDVQSSLATGLVREMGNAVAMAQGGPEQLRWVMRGVSQTFGKGKFTSEELQGQVFETAPMLRKAFAAAFGPGGPEEWEKARVKGGLSIADAWAKVVAQAALLPRAVGGAKNAAVNFTDQLKEAMTFFGRGLLGTKAGDFLDRMSARIENMLPNLEKLGAGLRAFADGLISKLPKLNVDLEGLLAKLVALDWRGAGEKAGAWLMAGFAKLRGWWGQLVAWFKGSGIGQSLADTFAKIKEVVAGIDFGKAFATITRVFSTMLSVLPALIPMIEAVGKALSQIPWASIASGIASVAKSVGDFAEKHPQAFVAILGALAANAALGNPVGNAVGDRLRGKSGAGGGEGEGESTGRRSIGSRLRGYAAKTAIGSVGLGAIYGAAFAPAGQILAGALAGAMKAVQVILGTIRLGIVGILVAVTAGIGLLVGTAISKALQQLGGALGGFFGGALAPEEVAGIDAKSDAAAAKAMGMTVAEYKAQLNKFADKGAAARWRNRGRAGKARGAMEFASSIGGDTARGRSAVDAWMSSNGMSATVPWGERYDQQAISGSWASLYMGGLSGRFPVGGANIVNGMSMGGGGRPGLPSIPGFGGDAVTIRHEVGLDAATRAALSQGQRASFERNMGSFVAEAATMGGM